MTFFDIDQIAFEILGYPLSYLELIGTFFGLVCVWLASLPNILTWPTGILNQILFFALFFQVQLYADMLLQVYFLAISIYGWYYWQQSSIEQPVVRTPQRQLIVFGAVLLLGTLALGAVMSEVHNLLPSVFEKPAAYPFADAFTTTASVIASVQLARKQIENWLLWMAVDVVSVGIYWLKDIQLVAIEYFVFLIICIFGYFNWRKKL